MPSNPPDARDESHAEPTGCGTGYAQANPKAGEMRGSNPAAVLTRSVVRTVGAPPNKRWCPYSPFLSDQRLGPPTGRWAQP